MGNSQRNLFSDRYPSSCFQSNYTTTARRMQLIFLNEHPVIRHGERQQAVLSVRDSGIGIDRDMLLHLFEPLSQADRSLDRERLMGGREGERPAGPLQVGRLGLEEQVRLLDPPVLDAGWQAGAADRPEEAGQDVRPQGHPEGGAEDLGLVEVKGSGAGPR
jgi:hypothetical protein